MATDYTRDENHSLLKRQGGGTQTTPISLRHVAMRTTRGSLHRHAEWDGTLKSSFVIHTSGTDAAAAQNPTHSLHISGGSGHTTAHPLPPKKKLRSWPNNTPIIINLLFFNLSEHQLCKRGASYILDWVLSNSVGGGGGNPPERPTTTCPRYFTQKLLHTHILLDKNNILFQRVKTDHTLIKQNWRKVVTLKNNR